MHLRIFLRGALGGEAAMDGDGLLLLLGLPSGIQGAATEPSPGECSHGRAHKCPFPSFCSRCTCIRTQSHSPRCVLACCQSLLGKRQLLGTVHPVHRHFLESGERSHLILPTPPACASHPSHESGLTMRSMRSRALGLAPEQVSEPGQVPGPRP